MIRLLFLICSLFIIPNVDANPSSLCTDHRCIAVVDAGSTGSRLHIFSYNLDETNTPTDINEVWSNKINPGLASIETNQYAVGNYLNTLFAKAPVQHLEVYFYATAGMRLVPQSQQDVYYQEITKWFNNKSEWQLVDAKTITGHEEALYDWLAVNYHTGQFKLSKEELIGVMDIGGASVQIVYPIENDSENQGSEVELDLYGQHIKLSVHSFLGLGQNEMARKLNDRPDCFPKGYPLANGNYGQGDFLACTQEITPLINDHQVSDELNSTLTANPIHLWYAMGGFPYLADSKPFHFENNQLTLQDLVQQADTQICQQQWEDLKAEYSNSEYIKYFCLLPAFYSTLMTAGYGLTPDQPINYIPSTQNLDWTLGVVLHPLKDSTLKETV